MCHLVEETCLKKVIQFGGRGTRENVVRLCSNTSARIADSVCQHSEGVGRVSETILACHRLVSYYVLGVLCFPMCCINNNKQNIKM